MELVFVMATVLGIVILFAVLIVLSAVIKGFVLSKLWAWFMVPIFGFPKISIVPAIGIALVVSFLTRQYQPSQESETEEEWKKILRPISEIFIVQLLVLFIGWILHLFM